jgi:hypothetical protein
MNQREAPVPDATDDLAAIPLPEWLDGLAVDLRPSRRDAHEQHIAADQPPQNELDHRIAE